jgi:quinol monooxygenase YgiN
MSTSFVVAVAGALIAIVLLGLLVRRTISVPRIDLIALLFAATGITVALIAQAIGYYKGFNPISFRVIQVGARLLAPAALAWALAEMTGRNFGARFAARLALTALTVVVAVILASDPLGAATFTRNWPPSSVYYQIIPNGALDLTAAATALAALVAVIVASVRARHNPAWRDLLLAIAAAATATLATDALREKLPANSAYAAVCVIAVALTWFAGWRSATMSLAALHENADSSWGDQPAEYGGYGYDSGYQDYSPPGGDYPGVDYPAGGGGGADFDGWFRDGPEGARAQERAGEPDSGAWYREDDSYAGDAANSGYGEYSDDTGFGPEGLAHAGGDLAEEPGGAHRAGPSAAASFFETGDMLPVIDGYPPPGVEEALDGHDTSQLYGQIAIYTLLEGHEEEFDQLAEQVVEKVKSREPDTLVYVMHGVPSAPMQRILYAAYRDEAAYAEHERQSYVLEFEEARKAYVLATNVIELGVRHAMFSPPGDPAAPPSPPARARESRSWQGP